MGFALEWKWVWREEYYNSQELLLLGALEKRGEAQGWQSLPIFTAIPAWYILNFCLASSLALLRGAPSVVWSYKGQELSPVRSRLAGWILELQTLWLWMRCWIICSRLLSCKTEALILSAFLVCCVCCENKSIYSFNPIAGSGGATETHYLPQRCEDSWLNEV